MLKAMMRIHWKGSWHLVVALAVAAFALPIVSVRTGWSVRQWENSWYEKYSPSPRVLGATLRPAWPLLVLGWSGSHSCSPHG